MKAQDDKKESKKASEEPEKQTEITNGLTSQLCKEKHQLMDCHKFRINPEKDRINCADKEKVCKSITP